MRLEPTGEGFQIGAADLGALLGMAPQDMQRLMRDGQITSLSEKGQDQDEGRYRITFRHRSNSCALDGECAGQGSAAHPDECCAPSGRISWSEYQTRRNSDGGENGQYRTKC